MKTFGLSFSLLLASFPIYAQKVYHESLILMGNRFELTVVAETDSLSKLYFDFAIDEITRIEKLISSWDENSQTSTINRNAGIKPVKVDRELFDLINRALKISKLTDGAFDISYASMDRIWKFDGSMTEMPTPEKVKESVKFVGYENILIDEKLCTVFLKHKGMKIGFGAIGKGYASDRAKALLMRQGIKAGIINASGDLATWGKQPDGTDWKVAIINPLNKNKVFAWMPVYNSAVVTSGNYEKYVMFNGIRYAHIINPRTGYPSIGLQSVSIFTQSAELADALATAVFVMGLDVGMDFINQMNGVECIIVDEENKVHTSKGITLNF